MSDPHLPDDVSRWPGDPYALLGVSFETPLREIKKAYARLIRRFRPEECPEQFRRIRDAFEAVQQFAKYSAHEAPDQTAPQSVDAPAEPSFESAAPPATPIEPPADFAPSPRPLEAELAHLWEKACAGDGANAYQRLRTIHEANPRGADVLPRLYWLLRLFPEFDANRHPCDWLAESLRISGLAAPTRELYRRFIADHPQESLSDRYTRLLEAPASAFNLASLLEWRWQAAGRLGKTEVIERDLSVLGPAILKDDEATWVRLLLFAADELAWLTDDRAEAVFDYCRQYLDQLEHVQATFGESYARLDFLADLSKAWKRMKQSAALAGRHSQAWHQLLTLVPRTWAGPLPEVRFLISRTYAESWADADSALAFFDDVQQQAPLLLAQLTRTFEPLLFGWFDRPLPWATDDEIELRTQRFLAGVNAETYQPFRNALRGFCFQEWLAPERMADVIGTRSTDANLIELFTQVRNDWPLRCLCLAHQICRG